MQSIFILGFRAQMESCQMTNQKENNLTHNKCIPTKRKANLQVPHMEEKTKEKPHTLPQTSRVIYVILSNLNTIFTSIVLSLWYWPSKRGKFVSRGCWEVHVLVSLLLKISWFLTFPTQAVMLLQLWLQLLFFIGTCSNCLYLSHIICELPKTSRTATNDFYAY